MLKARIRYKDKEFNKIFEEGEEIPTKDAARKKLLLDANVAIEVEDEPKPIKEKIEK